MKQVPNGFTDSLLVHFNLDEAAPLARIDRVLNLKARTVNLFHGAAVQDVYNKLLPYGPGPCVFTPVKNVHVAYDCTDFDESALTVSAWGAADRPEVTMSSHVISQFYGADADAIYHRLVPSNVKKLLAQLSDVYVSQLPDEYFCRCPAHNDRSRSLVIRQTKRGIVLRCNAGCDSCDVLGQLDMDYVCSEETADHLEESTNEGGTTMAMNHPVNVPAKELPIYDRAVTRYPHLVYVRDAMHFCQQLLNLAAVPGVPIRDYVKIGAVANGEMWPTEDAEARHE